MQRDVRDGGAGSGGDAAASATLVELQQPPDDNASRDGARRHELAAGGTAAAAVGGTDPQEAEDECRSCGEDSADEDVGGAPTYISDDAADSDAEFTGGPADAEKGSPWPSRARSRRHDGTLGFRARARDAMRPCNSAAVRHG